MEEHQYINQEMIFLILHEVSSTHSHEWAKGAGSDNLWRPHPAMSDCSTCYYRQVLGSVWSCNRMPERGLANRIITKTQEFSFSNIMNENDIGQVYFSHPHKDGGIKQWILHTCAEKVIEANFERKTIGFSWATMSLVILLWLWSSSRWITARWRSCHLVNTWLIWPHTSIHSHSLKVNIAVKQKRCQEIK